MLSMHSNILEVHYSDSDEADGGKVAEKVGSAPPKKQPELVTPEPVVDEASHPTVFSLLHWWWSSTHCVTVSSGWHAFAFAGQAQKKKEKKARQHS